MADPKTLTKRELVDHIARTSDTYEMRAFARELRQRVEASADSHREEHQRTAAARAK